MASLRNRTVPLPSVTYTRSSNLFDEVAISLLGSAEVLFKAFAFGDIPDDEVEGLVSLIEQVAHADFNGKSGAVAPDKNGLYPRLDRFAGNR